MLWCLKIRNRRQKFQSKVLADAQSPWQELWPNNSFITSRLVHVPLGRIQSCSFWVKYKCIFTRFSYLSMVKYIWISFLNFTTIQGHCGEGLPDHVKKVKVVGEGDNENKQEGAQDTSLMKHYLWRELSSSSGTPCLHSPRGSMLSTERW